MVESRRAVGKTFFGGVFLLTLSTLLVKVIGLFYKIPMLSYLGAVGMGYFNSAYEIYALFCVIATAGLPVALSVLISAAIARGERERAEKTYRVSLAVFLLIGALGSAAMALFSSAFCSLIKSENAELCIRAISPTVLIICISSAIRGYFQGLGNMVPTAVSQLLEAIGKLVFGLLFARIALERGYQTPVVAAAAGLGLTLGTLLSLAYLLAEKFMHNRRYAPPKNAKTPKSTEKYRKIGASLARLAIPVTLGASAVSLTKLIDMTMILRRLQSIGYSEALANEAYGSYTTLALSVFGLLPSLVNSVTLPLIPHLSAAIASGDREEQGSVILAGYRLMAILSIPASLGVAAFSRQILGILFAGEPQAVSYAAPLLSALGASIFLSCMITATNAILHAYQSVNRPILSLIAGAAVKIVSAYLLIGNPRIGMFGAPISTFLCDATVVALNLFFAVRLCPIDGLLALFLRPFGAALGAVSVSYLAYTLLAARIGESLILSLGALSLFAFLYLLLVLSLGVLGEQELSSLPMGDKLYRLLRRLRLMGNGKRKTHE